mmetsp:Transcript_13170/g.19878  ORF Transcript_13170/g.19878 Transcript_13170/m.19878 type:complete len:138 (-) Transcript_13170:3683-4096(-)
MTALKNHTITQIDTGYKHSLILTEDGSLFGVGSNEYNQVDNSTIELHLEPVKINISLIDTTIRKIIVGRYHSTLLLSNNTLASFGDNIRGQFGIGNNENQRLQAFMNTSQLFENCKISQIATYFNHSLFLDVHGHIY